MPPAQLSAKALGTVPPDPTAPGWRGTCRGRAAPARHGCLPRGGEARLQEVEESQEDVQGLLQMV